MKLSIIIPTYNSASVLAKALDSIVSQTFTDWEVLVMDGLSPDDTIKVAQSYNDSRIRIYSEPDKGIYDAMNKGIKKARGEWLYFLGSDDWLLNKHVIDAVFSYPIVEKYDVVYGDVEARQLDPIHLGEWDLKSIDYNRCHQGIFYRKSVFHKLGLYNLEFPIWADYDLNLKWFFSKKMTNLYIPIVIAHYSDGGFSSSNEDNVFLAKASLIKLKLGYNRYGRRDKITLINDALEKRNNSFTQVWLKLWKAYLVLFLKVKEYIK